MELNSTIKDTCKICTLGSLLGCLIILLFLNQTDQNPTYSVISNLTTVVQSPPNGELEAANTTLLFLNQTDQNPTYSVVSNLTTVQLPPTGELEPSNTTILNFTLSISPLVELDPLRSSNYSVNVNFTEKLDVNTSRHIERPSKATEKKCDIFRGKWVFDENGGSAYNARTCPFLEEKMSCQKNGRPDLEYEKWRWEATNCNLPLFNATNMLEKLRNKRVVIVGDSLNRNMWESLACLLYTSIPSSRAQVQAESSSYKVLKALEYNCVIEFYWSPFLIELNENHESGKKVLVLDKLSESSKQWQGADVMVFNSGHWWIHLGKYKSWDLFQYKGKLMEEMAIDKAYEKGMKTWAKWVKTNVSPNKTAVFFRSISPEHKNDQWCYNVTQPILDESYTTLFPESLITRIKKIISKLQVNFLDITKLSSYRRDAHPSIYRSSKWEMYTTKYKRLFQSVADCSHWCLPGLPDTWNRLFYASLFFHSSGDMSTS